MIADIIIIFVTEAQHAQCLKKGESSQYLDVVMC